MGVAASLDLRSGTAGRVADVSESSLPSPSRPALATCAFGLMCSIRHQGASDVASQVVGRLVELLKDKERKWRVELHRASMLEGENAELRARLVAAEQSNGRLRSRLHSGVAAFHRTLAQAKEKLEVKDGELSVAKAKGLDLQGMMPTLVQPWPQWHPRPACSVAAAGFAARRGSPRRCLHSLSIH